MYQKDIDHDQRWPYFLIVGIVKQTEFNSAIINIKGLNDIIISVNTEKTFGQIKHAFLIQVSENIELEETYLSIIKAMH